MDFIRVKNTVSSEVVYLPYHSINRIVKHCVSADDKTLDDNKVVFKLQVQIIDNDGKVYQCVDDSGATTNIISSAIIHF